MERTEFYSRGKLLLAGEYAVLDGALALAVPLKPGHRLIVTEGREAGIMTWTASHPHGNWFHAAFRLPEFDTVNCSDDYTAGYLGRLMRSAAKLAGMPAVPEQGWQVDTILEFDRNWGFGSSSSLISNVAWWWNIDPFALLRSVSDGSGYDVFCARASQPITYRVEDGRPVYREIPFRPDFRRGIYFIYLGRKQDSGAGIGRFRSSGGAEAGVIKEITRLTGQMAGAKSLDEFMLVMERHEALLSPALGLTPVKQLLFPDFDGSVKSLGAWGGDFVMAASHWPDHRIREYFRSKGLGVIFSYNELVY